MRYALCCIVFCIAGLDFAGWPSLLGQESAPPIPAVPTSRNTPALRVEEKPVGLTPIKEAQRLYRMGEFDKAIERYNAIIGSDNPNAIAYAELARVYLKLKKPNEAYLAATRAVEHDSSLATAHSALGEVYFRQGKLHEAQTEFLAALKANQADARSYLGLTRLYRATYNFKKAKIAIDKAHSLDAADPDIASAWVETRSRSEQVKALEDILASRSNYYSRAEKAGFKERLTVLRDEIEHPDRTCALVNRPDRAEMRLTPIGPKKEFVALPVHVDGVESRLVLSTVSSSGIVINDKIAKEAGIQPIARADIEGLGEQNPPEVYIGLARSLQVGNLAFQNCYVTVIEQAAPGSFYEQLEGLIPAGFFSDYLVDVDIPNAMLKLQPLPSRPTIESPESSLMDSDDPDARNFHDRYIAPRMATWTQMDNFGGAILIPARVNDSPPELFEVTTSSAYDVLAPDFARKWVSLRPDKKSARLEGINGKVSAESVGRVKLEFANLHFDAVPVISFGDTDSSESTETTISGYLGSALLRNLHISIDYRDGLIHFANDEGSAR